MTQRSGASTSPVLPSSPKTGIRRKARARISSMSAWQRTSSSSLMSWASAELTRFGLCQLARMTFPAARAALTAAAMYSSIGLFFIAIGGLGNHLIPAVQFVLLLLAFLVQHVFVGRQDGPQQVVGFHQARGGHVTGPGGIQPGNVRQ